MRIAKLQMLGGDGRLAIIEDSGIRLLKQSNAARALSDLIYSSDPLKLATSLLDPSAAPIPLNKATLLAPIDSQEVWAAGVTYKRSQIARMEESETGASHYDRVYTAPRPEIFFKATPHRVAGPGRPVRIRTDTKWSVPEPELALVISPSPELKLVGYTIGNDMSARDIEGENPLYLPQAKLYNDCCGLGPCILIPEKPIVPAEMKITLTITRKNEKVFEGRTDIAQMARTFDDLISWLGRDNTFPNGVILLTGTGVVPPNEFTLAPGDLVDITIAGIGTLSNPVVQG